MRDNQEKQFIKMTTEPVGQLLAKLSIPTILSMTVTNIYNLVDTAFVGTLGTSESGATGIVFGYMAILQAVAFMCGQGAGSIMSRRLGEKKLGEATKYASSGFFMSFSLGMIIAAISYIFMSPLLSILGSTATIEPYARIYIGYILISAPFFTSSLTMNNLLRYEGKAKLGTVGLLTGSVVNILGDAVFMFGLHMGIAGAGLSTALSQILSFSILISMFIRKKTQTYISIKYIAKDMGELWSIAATGFPSMLRQGLQSVATMILNKTAGVYGDEAVAAMSIVSRISFFPMAIAVGIGQGFQPISGFNYGANRKDRVKKAFILALLASEVVLLIISIPMHMYSPVLVKQLRDDALVIEIGARALRLMCIGQLFVPLTMMVEMGFQSTGKKLLASISSSLRSGIVFIPAIILLSRFRGLSGIQEAQPVSFVISFFAAIIFCKFYFKMLRQ